MCPPPITAAAHNCYCCCTKLHRCVPSSTRVVWDESTASKRDWTIQCLKMIHFMIDLPPVPNYLIEAIHCNRKIGCNMPLRVQKIWFGVFLACGGCKGLHCSNVTLLQLLDNDGWMDNQLWTMMAWHKFKCHMAFMCLLEHNFLSYEYCADTRWYGTLACLMIRDMAMERCSGCWQTKGLNRFLNIGFLQTLFCFEIVKNIIRTIFTAKIIGCDWQPYWILIHFVRSRLIVTNLIRRKGRKEHHEWKEKARVLSSFFTSVFPKENMKDIPDVPSKNLMLG